MRFLKQCGIDTSLNLDNFLVKNDWQKALKNMAKEFAYINQNKWFFVGGQSGSGKTLICSIVYLELIKKCCRGGYYMQWRDVIGKLKANRNDATTYEKIINPIKNANVLYIDDFFKTEKNQAPTAADVILAFEILNYRYNLKLKTIISTEKSLTEILKIDEAVGGRIYEMSRGFTYLVPFSEKNNYRLYGATK